MGDQINNAVRLEEKGYGEQMSLLNVNADELKAKLDRLINDQALRAKWKKASERIQRENRLGQVADYIAEFVRTHWAVEFTLSDLKVTCWLIISDYVDYDDKNSFFDYLNVRFHLSENKKEENIAVSFQY